MSTRTKNGPSGILVSKRIVYLSGGSVVKNPLAKVGDSGSISGSGRSPGEGNGNPPQHSCLGNPMDRGAWQPQSMGSQESDTTL